MQVLGLGSAATPAEIRRAYRHLALRYHPDKHGGSEVARRQFSEIATAYRTLMRAARATASGVRVGECCECQEFGEVGVGPDGRPRCAPCALYGPRRMLPLPALVVVRCVGTIIMLAVTAWLLMQALSSGRASHALLAFLAGMASLLILAGTCLRVVYCINPRRRR